MRVKDSVPAWWKQATPSRRAAIIFAALIAIGVTILLIARKPWQWELPPGRKLRIVDCVRIYSWWAGAANCLLMIALAATARWWLRPSQGGLFHLPRPPMPKWFLPLTIVAMLLCARFGAQRLRHSFWDDEVYAMRRAIHGQWRRNDDGSIKFRPVTWQETFWFFEKPQHQLHSIVTRIVLDTWRAVAKPRGLQFREDVARIPSYLAGILSVGAIAILLWRMGFPAAGVFAAFLFVVHPWHIRYASELRAYSFMLLMIPLSYVFLIEALDAGSWRWWSAFGASLFALMYSNALNIYPAVGAGLCGLTAITIRWPDPQAKIQIGRFIVVTLLAGMIFLQLMLPCVPQFAEYLKTGAVGGSVGSTMAVVLFRALIRRCSVEQHGAHNVPLHGTLSASRQPSHCIHSTGMRYAYFSRSRHTKANGPRTCSCTCGPGALIDGARSVRNFLGVPALPLRVVSPLSPPRRSRCSCRRLG